MKSKFEKLNNQGWLYEEYVNKKRNCREIGIELGCSKDSVRNFLIKWKIPLRTHQECQKGKYKGSYEYPALNDYEWLYDLYINRKCSLVEISDILDCANHNSVRQALKRFKIPIRDAHESQCINHESIRLDKQVIDGGLLGDAGLYRYNRNSDKSHAAYYRKNKFLSHIEWVAKEFYPDNYDNYISSEIDRKFNQEYYKFRTNTNKELTQYYDRWYPESNNFKKLVPRDLVIDVILLKHWFFDDGYTIIRNRKSERIISRNQVCGGLCSQSFSLDDNEYLCNIVNQKYALDFKPKRCGTGHRYLIDIPQSKITDFLDLIGPPIPCFQYKWKKGKWAS